MAHTCCGFSAFLAPTSLPAFHALWSLARGSYSDRPTTIYSTADIGLETNSQRQKSRAKTGWAAIAKEAQSQTRGFDRSRSRRTPGQGRSSDLSDHLSGADLPPKSYCGRSIWLELRIPSFRKMSRMPGFESTPKTALLGSNPESCMGMRPELIGLGYALAQHDEGHMTRSSAWNASA